MRTKKLFSIIAILAAVLMGSVQTAEAGGFGGFQRQRSRNVQKVRVQRQKVVVQQQRVYVPQQQVIVKQQVQRVYVQPQRVQKVFVQPQVQYQVQAFVDDCY